MTAFASRAVVLTAIAVTTLIAGCPPPPPAPFDTTGTYAGEWWGTTEDQAQEIVACPLTVELTQDVTLSYPGDHVVTGLVTVDYSCLELPEWAGEMPPATEEVAGILGDDGTLTLATGGCGTALCVSLVLTGQAADVYGDGFMDTYAGDWRYRILLAGVPPFGVDGGFDLAIQP